MKALETPRNAPLQNGILLCVVISISALRGRGCAFIAQQFLATFSQTDVQGNIFCREDGTKFDKADRTNESLPASPCQRKLPSNRVTSSREFKTHASERALVDSPTSIVCNPIKYIY